MKNTNPENHINPENNLDSQIPTPENSSAPEKPSYFQIPARSKHSQISIKDSLRPPKHNFIAKSTQKLICLHKSKKKRKPKLFLFQQAPDSDHDPNTLKSYPETQIDSLNPFLKPQITRNLADLHKSKQINRTLNSLYSKMNPDRLGRFIPPVTQSLSGTFKPYTTLWNILEIKKRKKQIPPSKNLYA